MPEAADRPSPAGPRGRARPGRGPRTEEDDGAPYHYGVIARAIARIDAAGGRPVPLAALASELGMSPAHVHRVFSRWAGISPKRFQQYLALDAARRLLAERRTVLEAALGAGLSGPGRLHDAFLTWEAMRPGDYARAGAGLAIAWGWFASPFGPALVMGTERGICGIGFADTARDAATLADLKARWPRAAFREDPARLAPWAAAAFGGGRPSGGGAPPLHLIGGPFHLKVWEALLAVPPGRVTTYGDLARAVGVPAAVRAVGTAVGRNPVAWLIPCHRVLRAAGALGGYRWGLARKRAMLACEAARHRPGAAD